jgi:adenylate cyclase
MNATMSKLETFESTFATVAFVDLAGFSALTDVHGDASAIRVLKRFEEFVHDALGGMAHQSSGLVMKPCLDFRTQ